MPSTHSNPPKTENSTTTQAYKFNTKGKYPNPYPNAAFILIDRKPNHINFIHHKSITTHKSTYLPLQSPYTRVYGKRRVLEKANSIPSIDNTKSHNHKNLKTHTNTHHIRATNPKYKLNLTLNPKAIIINCVANFKAKTRGASRDLTVDPDFSMREANSPPQGTKRSSNNKTTSAEKKTKSTPKELIPTRQFWLGFEMMEKLAIEEGVPLVPTPTSIHTLIRSGFSEKEAKDFLKAVPSFPHVNQSLFPTSRPDGIAGQHYNITQLPFQIDTDPDTGLSQDYQVAIFFQKPIKQYTHEEILTLTQVRLKETRIALGNKIAEPIAILCRNGSARHWAGTIKLHLKYPGVDGINLLSGTRPFMLTLDEVLTVGKICKSYNTIARNNLLSVKISSPSLSNVTGHSLFKEVLEESFKRSQELEISGVQKNVAETWAWLWHLHPHKRKR